MEIGNVMGEKETWFVSDWTWEETGQMVCILDHRSIRTGQVFSPKLIIIHWAIRYTSKIKCNQINIPMKYDLFNSIYTHEGTQSHRQLQPLEWLRRRSNTSLTQSDERQKIYSNGKKSLLRPCDGCPHCAQMVRGACHVPSWHCYVTGTSITWNKDSM